jgi:hypothetical protein
MKDRMAANPEYEVMTEDVTFIVAITSAAERLDRRLFALVFCDYIYSFPTIALIATMVAGPNLPSIGPV